MIQKALRTGDPSAFDAISDYLASLPFYAGETPAVQFGSMLSDARPVSIGRLLVSVARRDGIDHALEGFDELLALEENDLMIMVYVDNVETSEPVDLGDGVVALPSTTAPTADFGKAIRDFRNPSIHRKGAILVTEARQRAFRRLDPAADFPQAVGAIAEPVPGIDKIQAALRLMVLDGPSAPVVRLTSYRVQSGVPRLWEQPTGVNVEPIGGYVRSMPHVITGKVRELRPRYAALPVADRKRIDLALVRLGRAVLADSPADAIVETAIALEAVLGDARQELKYRVQLRAALLLETEYASRLATKRTVGRLYDERSAIVHTGTLHSGDLELSAQGIRVTARLLERLLEIGHIPDWNMIELTGGAISPAANSV
ncbi:hypothetical protein GGC65_002397 [Sphingopyxis sp. OAS728]|uniref:HEPN domain-containing protein n=1 Tax=Sphingopyxis sp. OAS728 TaxID=2663823 RepID=UPI00178A6207|nr:HEPN domain-containing protein [Sphingopyxis sp. OAS728]MBE1527941.1 hypothetical protein [Sphingopyxis sp. OAS728]